MSWREQIARALAAAAAGPARVAPRSLDPASLVHGYRDKIDDVPLTWLKALPGNGLRQDDAWLNALGKDITGQGLRDPLTIMVGKDTGTGLLGEGNHRLEALLREGYTHAPARTVVGRQYGSDRGVDLFEDLLPKRGEYFSADARPSDVFMSLRDYLKDAP